MTGPKLVAWELTRQCNLCCKHCRASAGLRRDASELSLDEARALVDDIVSFAKPILILTGGEPLLCDWLWDIVAYAKERGLKPVIGTNATLIDEAVAAKIAASGIPRISVSIDFPNAAEHDAFRGEKGAFEAALRGIAAVRRAGVEVQLNATVTKLNRHLLPQLHELALKSDVQAFHPFLLVPTGRGADLANVELTAEEYEETLQWVYETQKSSPLEFKPTDAPQYQRIVCQHGGACRRGCLAGTGFCFVSHVGDVQPCGYFNLKLGNVRERKFSEIWRTSPVLDDLRHPERLKGKCGVCEYKGVCGGCRARALARRGDYLAEEPYCAHVPDRTILDRIQSSFPLVERPYAALGEELGLAEADCYERVLALRRRGLIRRLGAFFDARRLGYVSTLVAVAVTEDRLDELAEKISRFETVTHNYARDGRFNLWFTVVAPARRGIDEILAFLENEPGVDTFVELPAVKTYKLRAEFRSGKGVCNGQDALCPGSDGQDARCPALTDADRALVRKFQEDVIDLGLTPFSAEELAWVRERVADGTIRRFGAIVNHRTVGYVANALVAWQVPTVALDSVGEAFAAFPWISHCYARNSRPTWPYGLFVMVHAHSRDELGERCRTLRAVAGKIVGSVVAPLVFETVREYKKVSMRYFQDHHGMNVQEGTGNVL